MKNININKLAKNPHRGGATNAPTFTTQQRGGSTNAPTFTTQQRGGSTNAPNNTSSTNTLNRSTGNSIQCPNASDKGTTIILIDWDDTLFPTTWLQVNNIKLTNDDNLINNLYPYFKELDERIYKLFSEMKKYGKIIIVTNAMVRWVHISGRVLKKSYEYIVQNVNIISARDLYQHEHPTDVYKWKENTFVKEIQKFINHCGKTHSLISIGDADYEYKALINLHGDKNVNNNIKYFKSIKFHPKANIEILVDQIDVLVMHLTDILHSDSHLDLEFNPK